MILKAEGKWLDILNLIQLYINEIRCQGEKRGE